MNILSFDTSSEILDICLKADNEYHIITRTAGLKHSELLLPGIQYVMKTAGCSLKDLDLIVCSKGPGSFTGLRIGISTAKGISAGSGIPLVSVPTLDALAHPFEACPLPVLAVIDAKKKRFYAELYLEGTAAGKPLDASLEDIDALCKEYSTVMLTGPHCELFFERMGPQKKFIPGPRAGDGCAKSLCILGEKQFTEKGADEDGEGPIYLRKSEAEIERDKKEK